MAVAAIALMLACPFNAKAEGKDGVAAVVNGEKITVAEMKQAYEDNKQIKDSISFKDFYGKTLDVFVNGKVLYQAAVADKVTETAAYKRQLEMAKEEIARKLYLEKKVEAKITDAEVKKLYADYKSKFKSEPEMKAKHILVESDAKAKEVISKLKKGGNFDALAKEYSKEPAELGYFTKSMMVPEFGNAAFALKKGQYSQSPVKTQYGYHVIFVEELRNSQPLPMKEVEPQLKAMLTQQAVGQVFQDVFKKAKIEKYDADGKVLPNEPAAPAVK